MRPLEALLVAGATLALVVGRPRGLNEGLAAIAGAAACLLLGLVPLLQAARLEVANGNVFLFFLGMMTIAAVADQSGAFDLIAYRAASLARGRVVLLYAAVFVLGAVISLFFANDSTALVLTPIVYALVLRLSLDPLPFVFATVFIADTASVGLPVSNPLNVIVSGAFGLGLRAYVSHLWLPALLVIVVNVGVFFVLFRADVRGTFRPMPRPEARPGTPSTFALLGLIAVGYALSSALTFPLGITACLGAAAITLNAARIGTLNTRRVTRDIGWPIFAFIGGMLVVVRALTDAGVTGTFASALAHAAAGPPLQTMAVATVGTALGANAINNLPMALVMVETVPRLAANTRLDIIYGTILGCDLGPNLTHLGSLATFLWLFFLRRKGLDVSAWDYFRVGVVVTPLLLVAAIGGLWLTSA